MARRRVVEVDEDRREVVELAMRNVHADVVSRRRLGLKRSPRFTRVMAGLGLTDDERLVVDAFDAQLEATEPPSRRRPGPPDA